jgi:anti-sigma regulatory factor (Ser/Thr protein kinase)
VRSSLTVQNDTKECDKLFDLLDEFSLSHNIDEETRNDLRLIMEETFTNIVNYAHEDNGSETIEVQLIWDPDEINMVFTDNGIAFNPITDCDRNIEKDDHCDGGMGIHIIKSLGDDLSYRRIDQKNVFTVTKHYTNQQ